MNDQQPILYLVIRNEGYYPMSGTMDWVLLTPSREEAEQAFKSTDTGHGDKYLVGLYADGNYSTIDHVFG